MGKVVVNYDESTDQLQDMNGVMIVTGSSYKFEEYAPSHEIVLELVKQGVTVDEIIKLKNMDLL